MPLGDNRARAKRPRFIWTLLLLYGSLFILIATALLAAGIKLDHLTMWPYVLIWPLLYALGAACLILSGMTYRRYKPVQQTVDQEIGDIVRRIWPPQQPNQI